MSYKPLVNTKLKQHVFQTTKSLQNFKTTLEHLTTLYEQHCTQPFKLKPNFTELPNTLQSFALHIANKDFANFYKSLHNFYKTGYTQLYTTRDKFTKTLHNCTKSYTTLHNFTTLLQQHTKLYNIYKQKPYTTLHHFTQSTASLHNLNTTSQLFTQHYQTTIHNLTKLYTSVQHSTHISKKTRQHFYNTLQHYLQFCKNLQHSTQLYKTVHNSQHIYMSTRLYTTLQQLYTTLHMSSKLYSNCTTCLF